LELLRGSALSRADISRQTGLSRSTISAIIAELTGLGLVEETGDVNHRGGRPGIMLQLAGDQFALIGIELGRARTDVVVVDLNGHALSDRELEGIDPSAPHETLQHLVSAIESLQTQVSGRTILGVGVGVSSPIDPARPGLLAHAILPGWEDFNLIQELETHCGLPVTLENDANMGAFGEYWWSGRTDGVVFVKVGTGVGAGILAGGRLYHGIGGAAGEIGHISITPDGPLCVCGQSGCLVKYVGQDAVQEAAIRAGMAPDSPDLIGDFVGQYDLGHVDVCREVNTINQALATALTSVVNVVAPRVLVLAGSPLCFSDAFVLALESRLEQQTLFSLGSQVRVESTSHGRQAIAMGAAGHMMASLFQDIRRLPHPFKVSA